MPKRYLPNRLFFLKRGLLLIAISFFAVSGIILPDKTPRLNAYYSSFANNIKPIDELPESTGSVTKSGYYAVLSEEVHEERVPTPSPTSPWGKSRQVDEHTWTIDVADDDGYASAREIAAALNSYRLGKGKGSLQWDQKLADYAQARATLFDNDKKLDGHAGFDAYIHGQDGFSKLGFNALGENSSIGYKLSGIHLIEWVYAGDSPHDDNQLSSQWTYVGVGVSGEATDLVFGGNKQ